MGRRLSSFKIYQSNEVYYLQFLPLSGRKGEDEDTCSSTKEPMSLSVRSKRHFHDTIKPRLNKKQKCRLLSFISFTLMDLWYDDAPIFWESKEKIAELLTH